TPSWVALSTKTGLLPAHPGLLWPFQPCWVPKEARSVCYARIRPSVLLGTFHSRHDHPPPPTCRSHHRPRGNHAFSPPLTAALPSPHSTSLCAAILLAPGGL